MRQEQERQNREAENAEKERRPLADPGRAERMERWKRSGMPRNWVLDHLDGWDQPALATLFSQVKATPFWPLDVVETIAHLEGLRREFLTEVKTTWR